MSHKKITELDKFISQERAQTFINPYLEDNALDPIFQESALQKAYQLYIWNTKMSGALLEILNWYEVALRNAIMKTINYKYYPYGILNNHFILSLNDTAAQVFIDAVNTVHPSEKYTLTRDRNGRMSAPNIKGVSEGRVIAELGFGFWENLLTRKYHAGLWIPHFKRAFPGMTNSKEIETVYNITKEIRKVRNRVCHCEPIFKFDCNNVLSKIAKVLDYIDPILTNTMMEIERISCLESERKTKAL